MHLDSRNYFLLGLLALALMGCTKKSSAPNEPSAPDTGGTYTQNGPGLLFAGGQIYYGESGVVVLTDSGWVDASRGMGQGEVYLNSSAIYKGLLHAAGFQGTPNYSNNACVWRWDGNQWSNIYTNADGFVDLIAVYNGRLYLSELAGSKPPAHGKYSVKRWNGSRWETIPDPPLTYPRISAFAAYNSQLYAGSQANGSFTGVGMARWDGTAWSAAGTLEGCTNSLVVFNNQLYAAGLFTLPDGTTHTGVVRYDGSSWTAVGASVNGVQVLGIFNGELYAGGRLATGIGVARWDGSSWATIGTFMRAGSASGINIITEYKGQLYVGAATISLGGANCYGVARWDGANWSVIGPGRGSYPETNDVRALAVW